tara:strand:+ start:530 stop:646 length:117 start_codon:yes stop_codon:yes gene_type:complete
MKKLLIILTIIFISCGSAEDEIASLEKEPDKNYLKSMF